jgi:uncharacterized protein (DUF1499 family)
MKTALLSSLLLLGALFVAARLGLFSGQPPQDLGVRDGRLKPPSPTRNSVSSQAGLYPDHPQRAYADIAPLPVRGGDGRTALLKLSELLRGQPELRVVERHHDYLRAEARTRWLRFVDDLEFWLDPAQQVIHVRSASRLGREDFGVNRKRIEHIRAAWVAETGTAGD